MVSKHVQALSDLVVNFRRRMFCPTFFTVMVDSQRLLYLAPPIP